MNLEKIEKKVISLIKKSSKIYYKQEFFEVEDKHKHENDDVTNNDIATQNYIKANLLKLIPGSCFIGEEGSEVNDNKYVWILDPIDGTQNYKHAIPIYGTQLVLQVNRKSVFSVIYLPAFNDLFVANKKGAFLNGKPISVSHNTNFEHSLVLLGNFAPYVDLKTQTEIQFKLMKTFKSIRVLGSAAYNYSLCACGKMEALVVFGNTVWDLEPGQFLVEKAGGVTYSNKNYNLHITGNKELVEKIKELLEV